MWIFTFFDLPTESQKQRKAYAQFRKNLIENGFTMMQFSVYIRHCASREAMDAHIRRVESYLPKEGKISIMEVTDKQYERIRNYWGKEPIA
jgi:CRISPR-associated protein Cas2